jgi:hypothetical protein
MSQVPVYADGVPVFGENINTVKRTKKFFYRAANKLI